MVEEKNMVELIDGNYLVWDKHDGKSCVVPREKVKEYLLKPYYFDSANEYMEYLNSENGKYVEELRRVDWSLCFDR